MLKNEVFGQSGGGLKEWLTVVREIQLRFYLVGKVKKQYYHWLQKKYRFDPWHENPIELRPYAREIVKQLNRLQLGTVCEIGCGLGSMLSRVQAETLYGYDLGKKEIACAKYLNKKKNVFYQEGSFDSIHFKKIDCLICVNFIHGIEPKMLKDSFNKVLKQNQVHSILVDWVEEGKYKYSHRFEEILPPNFVRVQTWGPFYPGKFLFLYENKNKERKICLKN